MSSVIVFWIASALVVIVTLGVLLRALLRGHPGDAAPADDVASVAIFRDQKRQLDDELANGAIDDAEHARLQKELAGRLGREVDHPPPRAKAASSRARLVVAAVLIVLIPVASGTLYFVLGRPAAFDTAPQATAKRPTQAQVLAMVETLAARMKSNPDDPKGWALLARSYAALGRFQESADAYGEAVKRSPGDASLLADQADALAMAQRTIQGTPTDLVGEALAIDPQNHKALALAAASAAERNEFDKSLDYWHKLASLLPPDSDSAREVADVIADTEKQRAAAKSTTPQSAVANSTAAQSAAQTGAPQTGASQSAAAAQSAASAARITGDVSLAPELAARARPDQTVFIFARAVDGPRMPLAVMRTTVRELPRAFVLDDSMAMAPGMTISSAKNVVVEARISQSGNAQPGPGDLVGKSATTSPGAVNIHVRIDTVNP
jgi:cytochrome c-type biogenesis protein CcmH